jgi:hypothetical protein
MYDIWYSKKNEWRETLNFVFRAARRRNVSALFCCYGNTSEKFVYFK